MSRKNMLVQGKLRFLEDLKLELNVRHEHLDCCYDQFKTFKGKKEDATSQSKVTALHRQIGLNAKMWQQTKEEKSAYYDEHQMSIHAMYGWTNDECQSYAALSD